jgi:hypothetical protein
MTFFVNCNDFFAGGLFWAISISSKRNALFSLLFFRCSPNAATAPPRGRLRLSLSPDLKA